VGWAWRVIRTRRGNKKEYRILIKDRKKSLRILKRWEDNNKKTTKETPNTKRRE
jgi:hypothetical protein